VVLALLVNSRNHSRVIVVSIESINACFVLLIIDCLHLSIKIIGFGAIRLVIMMSICRCFGVSSCLLQLAPSHPNQLLA
jgi:hypothetical protein